MQEIIDCIKNVVKIISKDILTPEKGYSINQNSSGDLQLKQDVRCDNLITAELSKCGSIKAIISEEKDDPFFLYDNAKYIVAYDPLDGSSVFEANFSVGSIFAIYEQTAEPKNLKCAIYSVYGAKTQIVICEDLPKLYTLMGDDFVYEKDLKLDEKGKINSPGGTYKNHTKKHSDFLKALFDEGYRLRYSGAMVADLHQILIKGGGIFSYPATNDAPNGKLRVLFEVFPFAYIFKNAGGYTDNGEGADLLSLKFAQTHATTPCYFGSKYEIDKLKTMMKD